MSELTPPLNARVGRTYPHPHSMQFTLSRKHQTLLSTCTCGWHSGGSQLHSDKALDVLAEVFMHNVRTGHTLPDRDEPFKEV